MGNARNKHQKKTEQDAKAKRSPAHKKQWSKANIMITVLIGICSTLFAVTFGFALHYWESDYRSALWWAFGAWCAAGGGIMLGLQLYSVEPTDPPNEAGSEASERRAWVGLRRAQLEAPIRRDQPIAAIIEMRNTGPVPALRLTQRTVVAVTNFYPLSLDEVGEKPGDYLNSAVDLLPDTPLEARREIPPINETEFAMQPEGSLYVYLIGKTFYTDVSGEDHETSFCFFRRESEPAGVELHACETGNSMD